MGAERRRHPRYEILAQVKLARGDTTYVLDVENISETGACVRWHEAKAPPWLSLGKRVTMDMLAPELPRALALAGEIVHVGGGTPIQFGVRFDEVLPEGSAELLAQIIRLAADSLRPPPLRRA